MKIWFDTEFNDRPEADYLELLSLGAVREDGATFYAENVSADLTKCNSWVLANVVPLFTGPAWTPEKIKQEFYIFCGPCPEFWAYFCTYDWWLLMKLMGGFDKLPSHWPKYCNELKTLRVLGYNAPVPDQITTEHHALNDALWNKIIYEALVSGGKQ